MWADNWTRVTARCFFMAFPWRWRGGDGCIVRVLAITDPDGDFPL